MGAGSVLRDEAFGRSDGRRGAEPASFAILSPNTGKRPVGGRVSPSDSRNLCRPFEQHEHTRTRMRFSAPEGLAKLSRMRASGAPIGEKSVEQTVESTFA